jgi:hypothetical protein
MSNNTRNIHFLAPNPLIEQADALATVFGMDRTEIITNALREYINRQLDQEAVERDIGAAYYDDRIEFDTLVALVGPKEAHAYKYLKAKLNQEPRDLPDVDPDADIYPEDFEPKTTSPPDA